VVEYFLYTEGVVGSNPTVLTFLLDLFAPPPTVCSFALMPIRHALQLLVSASRKPLATSTPTRNCESPKFLTLPFAASGSPLCAHSVCSAVLALQDSEWGAECGIQVCKHNQSISVYFCDQHHQDDVQGFP
jgi:hypothetical protein